MRVIDLENTNLAKFFRSTDALPLALGMEVMGIEKIPHRMLLGKLVITTEGRLLGYCMEANTNAIRLDTGTWIPSSYIKSACDVIIVHYDTDNAHKERQNARPGQLVVDEGGRKIGFLGENEDEKSFTIVEGIYGIKRIKKENIIAIGDVVVIKDIFRY